MSAWSKIISTASISGVPTENAAHLATQLVDRFQKPYWRFMNSGTEATLDAVRLARGWKGSKKSVMYLQLLFYYLYLQSLKLPNII